MKFTIIIPTLNAKAKLHTTLDSLVMQTYHNFECIIMDGGSSDYTSDIIKDYKEKLPELHFYSETDHGIYDAMNKAVKFSTGEYIIFMGAGDSLYHHSILERIHLHLTATPCDVLYGDICMLPTKITRQPASLSKQYFRSGKMLCHQSIIAKKQTLTDYPFNTNFSYGADRDWLIRNFFTGSVFSYIPTVIANYDTTGFTSAPENQKAVWLESGHILKQYYGPIMIPITYIKYYLIIKWRILCHL